MTLWLRERQTVGVSNALVAVFIYVLSLSRGGTGVDPGDDGVHEGEAVRK